MQYRVLEYWPLPPGPNSTMTIKIPAGSKIMKKKTGRWIAILLTVIVVILAVFIFFINPSIQREKEAHNLTACMHNLTVFGTAIEEFKKDNKGKLPSSLSELVPKYIISIPSCPGAGRDSYSESYVFSNEAGTYTVYCNSESHGKIGIQKGYPMYTSREGLIQNR